MRRARPSVARLGALFAAAAMLTGCPSFYASHLDAGESATPLATRFMTVDGVELRVLVDGPATAPPVVLLHGFGSSLETWRNVIPRLLPAHRVVAIDLKGFGLSARPPGDYSPEAEARLVAGVLDQLGLPKAAVVAHSWGSSVALALAIAAPERVTRLALYGAWIYDEQLPPFFRWAKAGGIGEALFTLYYKERPDERMARAFYDPEQLSEAYVERVTAELDRPGTIAAALAAVRGQDYLALATHYHTVAQPALLIWGREDRVSPPTCRTRRCTSTRNVVTFRTSRRSRPRPRRSWRSWRRDHDPASPPLP